MTVQLFNGDCMLAMEFMPSASVDMILCDLPYGTTQNKWDSVLPLDELWRHYWRIAKPNGAVVLTACQPFTSALVVTSPRQFRHSLVYEKTQATGHLNANRAPMRIHEDVLVFSQKSFTYNPQKQPKPKRDQRPYIRGSATPSYGAFDPLAGRTDATDVKFPTSIIRFATSPTGGDKGLHPTQKPVALMEYLIRTYTNEGDTVLDNTMGSGTTGVACQRSGRNFIGIERDPTYFAIAQRRLGLMPEPVGVFA